MKNLPIRIFYWNAPAAGALFGITLATVGSWLWFSLFHLLVFTGVLPFPWLPVWDGCIDKSLLAWALGQTLILIYFATVFFHFFAVFCRRNYHSPWERCWWLSLLPLLIAAGLAPNTWRARRFWRSSGCRSFG